MSFPRLFKSFSNISIRNIHSSSSHQISRMPKKENKGKSSKKVEEHVKAEPEESAVYKGAKGQIIVKVIAKPGANQTAVTDISPEGVGVRIAAPPVDGEANTELVKYMSRVLGVRKSDVSLDKGARSRMKVLEILSPELDIQSAMDKLKKAAEG